MERCTIRQSGAVSIVQVRGEIRIASGDTSLSLALRGLLAEGQGRILLDLEQVPFLDTMALGELVGVRMRARQMGGDLKLLNPGSRIRTVLAVTRLEEVFEIYDHEVKALEAF